MVKVRIEVTIGVVCLALAAAWIACGSDTPQSTSAPGAFEDGATLLNTTCSECHSPSLATSIRETHSQWDRIVSRMVARGAQLTDAEKSVLVDYLAANYGP